MEKHGKGKIGAKMGDVFGGEFENLVSASIAFD